MTARELIYRLLLTKDDNLDTSQVMLMVMQLFLMVWCALVAAKVWIVETDTLNAFLYVYGMTFLTSAPTWIAKAVIDAKWFMRMKDTDKSE